MLNYQDTLGLEKHVWLYFSVFGGQSWTKMSIGLLQVALCASALRTVRPRRLDCYIPCRYLKRGSAAGALTL